MQTLLHELHHFVQAFSDDILGRVASPAEIVRMEEEVRKQLRLMGYKNVEKWHELGH